MSLKKSEMVALGSGAVDFRLPGIDGETYQLSSFSMFPVLVIVFMCNHCPYVEASIDRLTALQSRFRAGGVRFVGINANDSLGYPEDSFENMKIYAEEWAMNFPYLRDECQDVARQYRAVCTPDIFVYDAARKLVYRGRIDDNWQHPELVEEEDLRYALEDLVEVHKVSKEQKPSMGCSIKWREK